MKIALAGNPNSGKTTLFNAITGKTEYVGNWPGVTVERKEASLRRKYTNIIKDAKIVDLPGAYSIAPYTSEEAITRDFVMEEKPDVIINIVDAAGLERSLFFTTQLLELGIPVVIALNKKDIVQRYGNVIDVQGLAEALKCRVVETVANEGEGLRKLLHNVADVSCKNADKVQAPVSFNGQGSVTEDTDRHLYVKELSATYLNKKRDPKRVSFGDRIDRVVANGIVGLPIFALIMWAVYAFSIEGVGGWLSGFFNDVVFGEIIPNAANAFFEQIGVHPLLQALIVDGAIGGVGAVIGFLPLIMVLFFCLALLEDSGYMARVAVVMDRFFKKIGLSGKSIIPMIVGSGCAIPGVMATRTIEDENEKKMTTILTPFVPCGAKLPVIALFSVVFFPGQTWIAPAIYLLSFGMIAIGGILLQKIFVWENKSSFIMELPIYKLPSLKHAYKQMMKQGKAFIVKASTIILVMNTLVWLLQTYNWRFQPVVDSSSSMLAVFGGLLSPLLIPLGFVGWQLAASTITGFIAKENVVASFAIIFAVASEQALHAPNSMLTQFLTPVTGLAFLIFNLYSPPCFAAIGAMNAEFGNKKWLMRAVLFQLGMGYMLALLVAQIGTLLVYGVTAPGFVPAIVVLASSAFGLALLIKKADYARSQAAAAL